MEAGGRDEDLRSYGNEVLHLAGEHFSFSSLQRYRCQHLIDTDESSFAMTTICKRKSAGQV